MPLDDLLISTGVDNLIKLVHERGRVEMRAASAELGVPLQTVEDWSHVLESEGIIKIQYQLTQIYLVWASMSPAEYEKTSKTVAAKKTEAVQKLEALGQSVDKNISELDELKGQFGDLQKKTRSELDALSTDRSEADRLAMQAQEVIGAKTTRLEALRSDLEKFHGELEGFQSMLQRRPEGGKGGALDVGAQMENLATAEGRLEEKIRNSDSQFESLLAEIQSMQSQLGGDKSEDELTEIKTSIEDLKFARSEMTKAADGMRNDVKAFGAEIANLTERLGEVEAKKSAAVSPKKALASLETLAKQTARERESTLADLNKNLEAVRKQIQAYSQAQYQYQTIKTHLESLQGQYSKESEELEQFLTLLDDASKRYAKDLATAKGSLASGQKEYEAMLDKARSVQAVLTQIDALRGQGEELSTKLRGILKEAQVVAMSAPPSGRGPGGAPGAGGSGAGGSGAGGYGAGGASGAGGAGMGGGAKGGAGGMTGIGSSGDVQLPPELAQRIALTTMEEQEFEKKREELRGLIKKMWDEDRKPPTT